MKCLLNAKLYVRFSETKRGVKRVLALQPGFLVHFFNTYWLSIHCGPGTIQSSENKADNTAYPPGAAQVVRQTKSKYIECWGDKLYGEKALSGKIKLEENSFTVY